MTKDNILLPVMSLLSMLLFTIHITDDIVRGFDKWGPHSLIAVSVLALWLWATLVAPEKRWALILILIGGLFAAGMPVIHMNANLAKTSGGFLFHWMLFALGPVGAVTVALAVRGLRRKNIMTAAAHENPDR